MTDQPKPEEFRVPIKLFELGQIVVTPGALAACSREYMLQCLALHVRGDWGCIDAEDHAANFDALFSGERILSRLSHRPGQTLRRIRREYALDHHRARPQRDHLPVARRVLTPLPRPARRSLGAGGVFSSPSQKG